MYGFEDATPYIQHKPCVYLLKRRKIIVYVGMTVNLYNRIAAHKRTIAKKPFDECLVCWYPSRKEAMDAERKLIAEHRPEYNIDGVIKHRRYSGDGAYHSIRRTPFRPAPALSLELLGLK